MATKLKNETRNPMLVALETSIGFAPNLVFYGNTTFAAPPPSTAAATATGDAFSAHELPSDWLTTPTTGVTSKNGDWDVPSSIESGFITYFRIEPGGAEDGGLQALCSEAWLPSTLYEDGYQVHNGGNIYRCDGGGTSAGSGGPTGTGSSIGDGSCTWAYVQTGTDMVLDNCQVNIGQPINILSFSITQGGA